MALATLDDLEAIGAIDVDTEEESDKGVRATRLLAMATATVCTFARTTEAVITDADPEIGWSTESKTTLAGIVAEVAARRLTSPASPSSNQLGDIGPAPYMSLRLTANDKANLMEIPEVADARSSAKPTSITVTRGNDWFETTGKYSGSST